LEQRNTGTV